MSAFQQQRDLHSDSSDTSSYGSTGSSYQLILDHILTYPGSYEIPLRTMYTLNCAPRTQPTHSSSHSSAGSSPTQQQYGWQDTHATQTFTESLMAQISQLPNQPTSLPPSFITSFVRRCFPPELVQVDFPQALTGLDYLKDLETRRRREVAAAMSRLAIDRTALDMDAASLTDRYPGVLQWVKAIEDKERKVEALYTQLYVALRRWILINELSLLPYNKHNCVAMLNTLYPPVISTQPTSKLTTAVLKGQRDGFFKYIISVEKNGTRILNNLMQQGKAPGEDNGWLSVTRTLGLYLQLANSIITECTDISDVQDLSPRKNRDSVGSRTARKVDSGVSFGSYRPSIRSNSNAESVSPIEPVRPKTPSGGRPGTALEKLARGLKTIGRSRTDVNEIMTAEPPFSPPAEKPKTLRKMRSLGALDLRRGQASTVQAAVSPTYDVEAMRLQRMKFDANLMMQSKFGKQSHEV
ncbi:hypothetical protein LTR85_007560 [Meristemomyces frigidus]|nr:hypothetical protein LTR85_007560 [Meristemomyces frigidus]